MQKVFFIGYAFFVASTIGFIIAILNPYWIIKSFPLLRGIFEICELNVAQQRICAYIFLDSDSEVVKAYRTRKSLNLLLFFMHNKQIIFMFFK